MGIFCHASRTGGCGPNDPLAIGPALNGFVGAIADLWSDSPGNLYFRETAPFEPNGIQRITPDGQLAPVGEIQLTTLAVSKDSRMAMERAFSDGGALTELTVGQDGALKLATIAEPATASSPDGTLATEAFLTSPAVRLTSNGEMYLLDGCNIRLVGPDGRLKTLLEDNTCISPPDAAVDSQDRLWFRKGGYDFIIDKQGNLQPLPLRRDLGVDGSIALDSKDRLYVMGSLSLKRLEADGSVTEIVQGPLPDSAPIFAMEAMGVDPDRNVYVVIRGYSGNPRSLYRVDDDGQLTEIQRGLADGVFKPFYRQDGFLIDGQGLMWASNGFFDAHRAYYSLGRNVAREIAPGAPELVQETGFSVRSAFDRPRVGSFGPDGSLYLEDGKRIRRIVNLQPEPVPVIDTGGIVNAASYAAGPVAPGELLSIFGSEFAPDAVPLRSAELTNNRFPESLGHVKVWFSGQGFQLPGAVTAVTPTQINVFVPDNYGPLPAGPVDVVVQVDNQVSAPMTIQIADAAPGLFGLDATGSGQGAILNQDLSVNRASNPAPPGSIVALFGTGMGSTSPEIPPGTLSIPLPYPTTNLPVRVTIGGMDAEIIYAGAAPDLASGVFQINARIPAGAGSGDLPVQVTIGDHATDQQLTVHVQ